MSHIALIGLGEVGAVLAQVLTAQRHRVLAWDRAFTDPLSSPAAKAAAARTVAATGARSTSRAEEHTP